MPLRYAGKNLVFATSYQAGQPEFEKHHPLARVASIFSEHNATIGETELADLIVNGRALKSGEILKCFGVRADETAPWKTSVKHVRDFIESVLADSK